MRKFTVVLSWLIAAQIGFAETTVELLQKRAEGGDATAQTLMGMVYQYGYQVKPDRDSARKWFVRAADQGDSYAAMRRDSMRENVPVSTRYSADPRSMPKQEIQLKIKQAEFVPYEGDVRLDDLALDRDLYAGKVVKLRVSIITVIGGMPSAVAYVYVRDPRIDGTPGGSSEMLFLCGEGALQWKLDVGKKAHSSASVIYTLVEKKNLIALGTRKRKNGEGFVYSW